MSGESEREEKLQQFREEVEDLENVIGVAWDPKAQEYVALVETKKDEEDVPENQLVANNTSLSKDEHGVVEVGHLRAHVFEMDAPADSPETVEPESSARHRPVKVGAEEQPDDKNWVGTASYVGRVTDTSNGEWADDVSEGSVVRISNWHVYVGDEFESHRPIHQPFRGDEVGQLVGCVPLADGVAVDVAARSVSEHDGWGVVDLDSADDGSEYGRAIVRDVTDEHAGRTVTKSGRTTDVTTAEINLIDVSVNVDYGEEGDPKPIRIDDCVLTTNLGDGGDSGSGVYLKENGSLCGLYFAGSDTAGVFCQIGNVESAFGVEAITDWDDARQPAEYGGAIEQDDVEQFKDDLRTFVDEWSPQRA